MITGNAEVRWDLQQWTHGSPDPASAISDWYDDEPAAREAFNEACRDRSVARARLVMRVEIESASHFKAGRK